MGASCNGQQGTGGVVGGHEITETRRESHEFDAPAHPAVCCDHVVDAQAECCGDVVEVFAVVMHRYFDMACGAVVEDWSTCCCS